MTKKEQAEYGRLKRDIEHGRLLTPDGLRMICSACEYDATKIGQYFLELLGRMTNDRT